MLGSVPKAIKYYQLTRNVKYKKFNYVLHKFCLELNMSKLRNTGKIEATIEICRSEGKWKKVIDLAENMKNVTPNYDSLATFLIGEGYLESYLEENSSTEVNASKAKIGLQEAKKCLSFVTGEDGKKAGIALDAHLLLAKIYYMCQQYEECIENFEKAELSTLSEKELTLRSLKILSESYAIKGLCLESQSSKATSKFKRAERESEMIACFEKATDLGLLYLQEHDLNNSNNDNKRMGVILETALQRAPIVIVKLGKLLEAIERYRAMLCAVEVRSTQSLRLALTRQLAEVLLRGVPKNLYSSASNHFHSKTGNTIRKLWKPRKYSAKNHFLPRNHHEEIILLLLISEALAVKDAVLSQSPEFKDARSHALKITTGVYDLLTLATVKWGLISLLNESFEKALKFSFGEKHVWGQYSLCLTVMGKYTHAVCALKQSSNLSKTDPLPALISARICYEHLGLTKEGLDYANEALSREYKGFKNSRAQLYIAIGFQQIAFSTNLKADRQKYNKLALEALEKATQNDSNDHLGEYYLALHYALNHNLTEALVHIRLALTLRTEHAPSLHLFALLLTANRRPKEAYNIIENALLEFPDNFYLLHVKAHLQLHLHDSESALNTVQKMFLIWRDLYETQILANEHEYDHHSDTKSIPQFHCSQFSDKDSNSLYAASVAAASRIEQALSDVASSMSSLNPRAGPQKPWFIQINIWLLLAEVYLAIDQPNEALHCIQEAHQIYPLSHQVMYMRGLVYVYLSQLAEAKLCFRNAISANPCYTDALRALGETHHILGEPRLAEKMLKDAVKLDPNCPKIWFSLGKVMNDLGDHESSADCMATALQLEPYCPVLPFTSIALTFE